MNENRKPDRRPMPRTVLCAFVLAAVLAGSAAAQTPPAQAGPPPLPKVFVDGPGMDIGYLRTEIPFVEFVSDITAAQVHVVVSPEGPPGAGPLVVSFIGLKESQGDDNELSYEPPPGAAPEEVRMGLAGTIKLGLLRYAAKTPVAKDLSVKFLDQAKPTSVNDKWDFWVFSLSGNAFLTGETQYRNGSYYASVSASRACSPTEEW